MRYWLHPEPAEEHKKQVAHYEGIQAGLGRRYHLQERIHLVEVIWESIAAVPHALEVSPELKTELNARLADFERNPEAGYSWDQVKAHLKSGSWRTA